MAETGAAAPRGCRCGAPFPADHWRTAAAAALVRGAILVLDVVADGSGPPSRPERRRALSRQARNAVRHALSAATGCDPSCVLFDAPGDVRPRIAGLGCGGPQSEAVREFGISFSYAPDRALAAIGRNLEVGVDIEAVSSPTGRERRYQAVHAAYFGDDPASEQPASLADFLDSWTRHEACLKARGDGIVFPAEQRDPAAEGYTVHPIEVGPGHAAAIAAKTTRFDCVMLSVPWGTDPKD